VVDTGDNKVVNTIPASNLPTALSSDGKYLFAFGTATDQVFNINAINTGGDGTVAAVIPLKLSAVNYPLDPGASLNTLSTAIALSADSKHLYVAIGLCPFPAFACHPEAAYFILWDIDPTTKTILANTVGKGSVSGIVFAPDGQHIYLSSYDPYYGNPQVLVVATADTISLPVSGIPLPTGALIAALAVSPDGKSIYVPYLSNFGFPPSENVSVISTASNTLTHTTVVEANTLGTIFSGIAVTPNGEFVYVSNQGSKSVAVLSTANNAVVKTIPVGSSPGGLAVTPDGAHVYVVNAGGNSISVIANLSRSVVATVPGSGPTTITLLRAPQGPGGIDISAELIVSLGHRNGQDAFDLQSSITAPLGLDITPATVPFNLQVGPFFVTLPAGSFTSAGGGTYLYDGFINGGAHLQVKIVVTGPSRFAYVHAKAVTANLGGIANPVQVSIGIGKIVGLNEAQAQISKSP
jgi:YVTN family beta-propeller protein